jgi:surfactin synthase thioesterase subunit
MEALTANESHWIARPRPNPEARHRLFCFPYAGMGAAAFRGWWDELPPDVEICLSRLPGRDSRLREAPYDQLLPLATEIAEAIAGLLDRPFSLFGHSMGAWLAFEVARQLRRAGSNLPSQLFVSGRRAPHLPDRETELGPLTDAEFVTQIRRRFDGIPQAIVDDNELLQLMLPSLRADVTMLETYVYRPEDPFDCPIVAFGGSEDNETTVDDLNAWQLHTTGRFALKMFPGGHFFLNSARSSLLSAIASDLGRLR